MNSIKIACLSCSIGLVNQLYCVELSAPSAPLIARVSYSTIGEFEFKDTDERTAMEQFYLKFSNLPTTKKTNFDIVAFPMQVVFIRSFLPNGENEVGAGSSFAYTTIAPNGLTYGLNDETRSIKRVFGSYKEFISGAMLPFRGAPILLLEDYYRNPSMNFRLLLSSEVYKTIDQGGTLRCVKYKSILRTFYLWQNNGNNHLLLCLNSGEIDSNEGISILKYQYSQNPSYIELGESEKEKFLSQMLFWYKSERLRASNYEKPEVYQFLDIPDSVRNELIQLGHSFKKI